MGFACNEGTDFASEDTVDHECIFVQGTKGVFN